MAKMGLHGLPLDNLADAYKAPPFIGPDQQALEKMMMVA